MRTLKRNTKCLCLSSNTQKSMPICLNPCSVPFIIPITEIYYCHKMLNDDEPQGCIHIKIRLHVNHCTNIWSKMMQNLNFFREYLKCLQSSFSGGGRFIQEERDHGFLDVKTKLDRKRTHIYAFKRSLLISAVFIF